MLDNKLLLLSPAIHETPVGGRELLSKLNRDILQSLYGDRLIVYELSRQNPGRFGSIAATLRGYIDGLSGLVIEQVMNTIHSENVTKVFVDGSNLGAFVRAARAEKPELEISTFFHNVEARFFFGALRVNRSIKAIGVMVANYLAERKTVRDSDNLICLSERDSRLLQKLYGRSGTYISPMALQDTLPSPSREQNHATDSNEFLLFVGGFFYANRNGMAWFVDEVAPRISIETVVVGRGFEADAAALGKGGNIRVVGQVDSLAEWYAGACAVIAPIFDGSGMKTKVAEALMFGKKVIGTPEAFSGYEAIAGEAGWICRTPDEFVTAIREARCTVTRPFDHRMRSLYEKHFSYEAARTRLAKIVGPL